MTRRTPAVLSLHLQNYTLDERGAIGGRGSAAQVREKGLVKNVSAVFEAARAAGVPIIHVGVGFDDQYTGMNDKMPIFSGMRASGELKLGSWGVEFFPAIAPAAGESVLYHGGLGPFAGTPLDRVLVGLGVDHLLLFGVSVRWVVEAATYEALDRGYSISVLSDCSAASTEELEQSALSSLVNFGEVMTGDEAIAAYFEPARQG